MKKVALFIFLGLLNMVFSQPKDTLVYLSVLDDLVITERLAPLLSKDQDTTNNEKQIPISPISIDSANRINEIKNSADFYTYLRHSITYTPNAKEAGIYGKISIQFDIDSLGNVCNLQLVKRIEITLDTQVFNAFLNMPKFIFSSAYFYRRIRYEQSIIFRLI